MLTSDLLRVRVRKGTVEPRYLDCDDEEALERAAQLCALFQEHTGGERGALDEAIDDCVGHGTDWLIWRGLAKLLHDRSTFETVAAADPVEVRRLVFGLAAERGPISSEAKRQEIFEEAALRLEIEPGECEAALYADLEARQRLTEHKKLAGPKKLLERYNLALAQAVLYRATSLEILLEEDDPNRLRYLFQALKFFRLMHTTRRVGPGSWHMVIDGPASLFSQSRKYGLQMAKFLPALLLMDGWQLRAELDWKGKGRSDHSLQLSDEDGLVSHYRARGQWVAEEERMLEMRFEQLEEDEDFGWKLERAGQIVELDGGEVLVSDYVLRRTSDGARVLLEVVGFWRANYLKRRLEGLRAQSLDQPLVLIVGERLQIDREPLEASDAEVVTYKGVILPNRVLEAARAALEAQG